MDKLLSRNIPVYRTDECGTIVATSDGSKISFSVKPGDYKAGGSSSASTPTKTAPPQPAPNGVVYWLNSGTSKSYHSDPNCQFIKGKSVSSGSVQDAINEKHPDPCNKCVK